MSGKVEQNRECGQWEGREKLIDVLSGKLEQNREMCSVGWENKAERCVEWDGRTKQGDVLSGKL